MDQSSSQPPRPLMGIVPGAAQIAYAAPPYAPPMVAGTSPVLGAMPSPQSLVGASPFSAAHHQFSYQQFQHHQQLQEQQQQQQLLAFWSQQMHEIEQTTDFKNHSLPLARIKKIMKADEDVRMISAEAPVMFSKACEMFILELTMRSWIHTEENKRRTLQKNDIAAAITRTDIFDFLVDIVPRDESKEDGLCIPMAPLPGMGSPSDTAPCYYVPGLPQFAGAGMIMGNPLDQTTAAGAPTMYASASQAHPMAYVWPRPNVQPEQHQMPDGD